MFIAFSWFILQRALQDLNICVFIQFTFGYSDNITLLQYMQLLQEKWKIRRHNLSWKSIISWKSWKPCHCYMSSSRLPENRKYAGRGQTGRCFGAAGQRWQACCRVEAGLRGLGGPERQADGAVPTADTMEGGRLWQAFLAAALLVAGQQPYLVSDGSRVPIFRRMQFSEVGSYAGFL